MSNMIRLSGLGAALLICFHGCDSLTFPTRDEIDSALEAYQLESSIDRRVALLKNLLDDLRNPRKSSHDHNVEYALGRMREIYVQPKDEAILVAIDETPIYGAFANFVCDFYSSLSSDEAFRERYRNHPEVRMALMRCEGLTFSIEDIREITGEEVSPLSNR